MICSVTIPDVVLSINLINLKYHKFNLYYYKEIVLDKRSNEFEWKTTCTANIFPSRSLSFLIPSKWIMSKSFFSAYCFPWKKRERPGKRWNCPVAYRKRECASKRFLYVTGRFLDTLDALIGANAKIFNTQSLFVLCFTE